MPLIFASKRGRRVETVRAQGSLFDPTVVGRSFQHAALEFKTSGELLHERLREFEQKRRRAQIKARRVLDGREAEAATPVELPFAV